MGPDHRRPTGRCGPGCPAHAAAPARPPLSQRRALTLPDVSARLEHRLYRVEPTPRALAEGCADAVDLGLSAVIARPETVREVASGLAGTSLGVVTVPGWRDEQVERLSPRELVARSHRLADEGATDIGVLVESSRLATGAAQRCAEDVTALVAAMSGRGTRVRVVLDTDGLSAGAVTTACELFGTTGAGLVQGGSWTGTARTGFSRVQLMRAALPAHVRLKWTYPVRSLDSMMICVAEGVDLFNGDPGAIMAEAARRIELCPLVVPVRGLDY